MSNPGKTLEEDVNKIKDSLWTRFKTDPINFIEHVLVMVLIICICFAGWKWNGERKARLTLEEKYNSAQTIAQIEQANTDALKKADAQNAILIERMKKIDKKLDDLYKIETSIKPVTQGELNEIEKADINSISSKLNAMGYPVKIVGP